MLNEIKETLGEIETQQLQEIISNYSAANVDNPTTTFDIIPQKGFVIKSRIKQSKAYPASTKIFINVCHSIDIPKPIMDQIEIEKAISGDESSTFKMPMSLSVLRSDIDKKGDICVVTDCCINSICYSETSKPEFKQFVIDLVTAWVQQKHDLELDSIFLPKLAAKGNLVSHSVRKSKKPIISEVVTEQPTPAKSVPKYLILKEPKENPKYLVIQIHLDKLLNSSDCELELEDKRLILEHPMYFLDIELPVAVNIDECEAEFNCGTRYLHLTATCL